MHELLVFLVGAIALAHDRWQATVGRRLSLRVQLALAHEKVQRLQAENDLLRARLMRVPPRRRPHYRRHERLEILLHAARYRMSVTATARAFAVTRKTILAWRRCARGDAHLLPPLRTLSDLVHELVHRLKAEWPGWGTRRIAGHLVRLGLKVSRTSVQRILVRPRRPGPAADRLVPDRASLLLAGRPNHVWMIDFTRLRGTVRPVWVGAVMDVFSRKVLAVGVVRGGPSARFATRLLRRALACYGPPVWLVTDRDTVLRSKTVNALLHRHGIRRRYGAVGRKGSIALIERMWRSLKQEYARHLFLYASTAAIEKRLRQWARWFNAHRPHQGLGQRTPDDVYHHRRPRPVHHLTAGTLSVRFLGGDPRLPVLRLHRAA